MVRLFGFEFRRIPKGASPRSGYRFTDEDHEASAEIRRMRHERKKLQEQIELRREEQKLRELEEELSEYDEEEEEKPADNADALLLQILAPVLSRGVAQPSSAPSPVVQSTEQYVQFTDDEIRQTLKQFGKSKLKMAKAMPDDTLRKFVRAQIPTIHPESEIRALHILRSEF